MIELREPLVKRLEQMGVERAAAYWAADRFLRDAHDCPRAEVEAALEQTLKRGITNLNYAAAILRRKGYLKPERVRTRGVDELDDPFAEQ